MTEKWVSFDDYATLTRELLCAQEKIVALTEETSKLNDKINKQRTVIGDLSVLLRRMITKHRSGKLGEEFCVLAQGYLRRRGLQGNVLRAMNEEQSR